MSDATVLDRLSGVNGTAKRPARKPQLVSKPRCARKAMKHARRLACAVGAVGAE